MQWDFFLLSTIFLHFSVGRCSIFNKCFPATNLICPRYEPLNCESRSIHVSVKIVFIALGRRYRAVMWRQTRLQYDVIMYHLRATHVVHRCEREHSAQDKRGLFRFPCGVILSVFSWRRNHSSVTFVSCGHTFSFVIFRCSFAGVSLSTLPCQLAGDFSCPVKLNLRT